MRHLKLILVFFTFLLFSVSAFSAPVHVEVIIFANNTVGTESEWFPIPDEIIRVEETTDEGITPLVTEEESSELENNQSMDLEATGPRPVEAYVLIDFANAIDENPDFELLNYVSWIQEPVPKSRTKSVSLDTPFIDSFLSTELLLAGETSVYEIAQLLQFDIQVTYKPLADTEKAVVYLPDPVKLYTPETSYLLAERRQIQINDIHYFDHPKFGVVFTIIRPKQAEFFVQ